MKPRMIVIPGCHHCGDGKNRGRMSGGEGNTLERRFAGARERVVKRPSAGHVHWTFSPRYCFLACTVQRSNFFDLCAVSPN